MSFLVIFGSLEEIMPYTSSPSPGKEKSGSYFIKHCRLRSLICLPVGLLAKEKLQSDASGLFHIPCT
jgi:hypothetical protein